MDTMMRSGIHGSRQLTLGELTHALEALSLTFDTADGPHPKHVYFDFGEAVPGHLTSWRGSYAELAITFNDPDRDGYHGYKQTTAAELLTLLRDAHRRTFGGWKGGEYQMREDSPAWVALWGQSSRTAVVGVRDLGWEIIIDTEWTEF